MSLHKNYMPQCFQDIICNIQNTLRNKNIWISTDKTKNAAGQYSSGIVDGTKAGNKSFLMNIQIIV